MNNHPTAGSKAELFVSTSQISSNPACTTIPDWCALTGTGRSATYEASGRGDLRAIKLGARAMVDGAHGLAWLGGLPVAIVRPRGAGQRKMPLNGTPLVRGSRGAGCSLYRNGLRRPALVQHPGSLTKPAPPHPGETK